MKEISTAVHDKKRQRSQSDSHPPTTTDSTSASTTSASLNQQQQQKTTNNKNSHQNNNNNNNSNKRFKQHETSSANQPVINLVDDEDEQLQLALYQSSFGPTASSSSSGSGNSAQSDTNKTDNNRQSKGDFHKDNTLCSMFHDFETNISPSPTTPNSTTAAEFVPREAYRTIVDQNVLCGIVDHVYSDDKNEVLGLLGGSYDSEHNIVHIKHYCASVRDVNNMAIDGVECDGNEVVKAQNNFSEKGLIFVGWYHSHPRIPPFPSVKDLNMQHEMQMQAPYALGIICSAYYDESTSSNSSDKHSFYFNCFRTRQTGSNVMDQGATCAAGVNDNGDRQSLEAISVMCTVNHQPLITPEIRVEMQNTLHTAFLENCETFINLNKKYSSHQCNHSPNELTPYASNETGLQSIFLRSQYQSFLFSFWKNSIVQNGRSLQQDLKILRRSNEQLQKKIRKQRAFLMRHMSEDAINELVARGETPLIDTNRLGFLLANPSLPARVINSHDAFIEDRRRREQEQLEADLKFATELAQADSQQSTISESDGEEYVKQQASTSSESTAQSALSRTTTGTTKNENKRSARKPWLLFGSLGKSTSNGLEYYSSVTIGSVNYEVKEGILYRKPGTKGEFIGQIHSVIEDKDECLIEVKQFLHPQSREIILSNRQAQEPFGEDELYSTDELERIDVRNIVEKVHVMTYDDYLQWKFGEDNTSSQASAGSGDKHFYYSRLYDFNKKCLVHCTH